MIENPYSSMARLYVLEAFKKGFSTFKKGNYANIMALLCRKLSICW
jgi:hypothetical protein